MIRKGISLAMAAVTLIVYLQSQLASNDDLFLFTSNNTVVNICLVALASSLVWLSFQKKFSSAAAYVVTSAASGFFSLVGLIGVLSAGLDRFSFGLIKPLDYAFLLEAGIITAICALTYQHPKVSLHLPSFDLSRLRQIASALVEPAIPNSTNRRRPHVA